MKFKQVLILLRVSKKSYMLAPLVLIMMHFYQQTIFHFILFLNQTLHSIFRQYLPQIGFSPIWLNLSSRLTLFPQQELLALFRLIKLTALISLPLWQITMLTFLELALFKIIVFSKMASFLVTNLLKIVKVSFKYATITNRNNLTNPHPTEYLKWHSRVFCLLVLVTAGLYIRAFLNSLLWFTGLTIILSIVKQLFVKYTEISESWLEKDLFQPN